MAGRRRARQVGGTVVLDADGLTKAARADQRVQALLTSARNRDARVVVSAVTLAQVLRGTPRDAAAHRVVNRVTLLPVTADIARAAGSLLGSTGLTATVDAIVAATAGGAPGPVLLLTSDPHDLGQLTAGMAEVAVIRV